MKIILALVLTATCSVSLSETEPDREKDGNPIMGECGWTKENSFEIDSNDEKIRISADNASYEEDDITALSGDVKITGRGQQIRASQITIDNRTQSYFGEGAIYFAWLGTLIGLIALTGGKWDNWGDVEKMGPALSVLMLTLFYGYTIKIITLAFED